LNQLEQVDAEDVVYASASSNTILETPHPVHPPDTGAILSKNTGCDFGVSAIDTMCLVVRGVRLLVIALELSF